MATKFWLPILIAAVIWTAQPQSAEAGSIRYEMRVVNSVETDQNEMNNSPTPEMDPIVFASDRMVNWL